MNFLFVFLPLVILINLIPNERIKTCLLVVASVVFYYFADPGYTVLILICTVLIVAMGRFMPRTTGRLKQILLICGIVLNVGILACFKYYTPVAGIMGLSGAKQLVMPLGISYFTFKAISYLVDIYSGKAEPDSNPLYDILYLIFFGQIQTGPLVRYQDMKKRDDIRLNRGERSDHFSDGVTRFMIGLSKKLILADTLANIVSEVFATPIAQLSVTFAWLGAIAFSMQLYYDFSGCADMAIGLTKMFGYECCENFDYPYMTESISRFWRRWHISLGSWFRDYVYIPLGGSRSPKKYKVLLALFVTWILTGIWHGSTWNFIVWGIGYFVLISFERITGMPKRLKSNVAKAIYRCFTLVFIIMQWVIFRAPDIKYGWGYIKSLFGCHSYALNEYRAFVLMKDYWLYLFASIVFCMPVIPKLEEKLKDKSVLLVGYSLCKIVVLLILFWISISTIASGQFKPFVYANF